MKEPHTDLIRVLVVDGDSAQAGQVADYLRLAGAFQVELAGSVQEMQACLDSACDIILADYRLQDGTGLEALEAIHSRGSETPVVLLTAQGDERLAVEAIQNGAADYLLRTGDYLLTLPFLIRKTIHSYRLQLSVQQSMEKIGYQALLLNNVRDAVVVWDLEGKITFWNPAAFILFGWMPQERLGKQVAEVYLPVFNPPVYVPKEGETIGHHIERQYRTRNNQTIWVSSRITALYDSSDNNRLIGYMDVSHDITQRKQAEQALRAERNFVSAVLDTVGALVVVLDTQGRIVRFNRTCEQITGYTYSEVRGRPIWDLFLSPEDVPLVKQHFQKIQLGDFPNEFENIWRTRSGDQRLVTWSNTALTNNQGQVEYIIATGIDNTERRQAEQDLRESEARYRAIVEDYQTELICRFAPDGALLFVNEAFCRYFNQSREELLGRNLFSFTPDGDRQKEDERLALFNPASPVATSERPVRLPNQGLRWLQWTDRAIFDDQGRLFEFQSVGRDITERKRMEAQIAAAQTHLTQATRLATIGEMASGVAHQINNPLTTLIAEAQILLRTMGANQPGRDSAEAIEQAGWRLQEVVQRLLEFSRPAAVTLEPLSVNRTIERALSLVGGHIEAVGVSLEKRLAENLPAVRGSSRQLEDLWVNLLLLARDATANDATHTICVTSSVGQGRNVTVEVRDDGDPIPSELLESIFEPNFIGPTSGRGAGMELSICREIVRQHGGQITAETVGDHDTIIRVVLPTEGRQTGRLIQPKQPNGAD